MRARSSPETDSSRRNARDAVIGLNLAIVAAWMIVTLRIPIAFFVRSCGADPPGQLGGAISGAC
jgi:hypothetical protein